MLPVCFCKMLFDAYWSVYIFSSVFRLFVVSVKNFNFKDFFVISY